MFLYSLLGRYRSAHDYARGSVLDTNAIKRDMVAAGMPVPLAGSALQALFDGQMSKGATAPAPSVQSSTPTERKWQTDPNADPAGGAQVIESWNVRMADELVTDASSGASGIRKFVNAHLSGRTVVTKVGPCFIGANSGREIATAGGRRGGLKLRLVARIPESLIHASIPQT